ncbi:MAG: C40 family peptidase [Pseudomonadota bacterium]
MLTRTILIIWMAVAGGCAWESEQPEQPAATSLAKTSDVAGETQLIGARERSRDIGWIVASLAQEQVGAPYRFGGSTPAGFDCSGLVNFAYGQAGMSVPRTTETLWRRARPIPLNEAQPGDLVFFNVEGKPGHVGVFVGDGYFVHAPSTGRSVTTQSLNAPWYAERLLRVGRLID